MYSIINRALDKWLTKETVTQEVIVRNNMRDEFGRQIGIKALVNELKEKGYTMENKRKTIEGKKTTVYIITKI